MREKLLAGKSWQAIVTDATRKTNNTASPHERKDLLKRIRGFFPAPSATITRLGAVHSPGLYRTTHWTDSPP
jgi:hypothetical protein